MGRKHRSSSLGYVNGGAHPAAVAKPPPTATNSTTPTSSGARAVDVVACRALLKHFVHGRDGDGRTVLHRAVEAASPTLSHHAAAETEDEKLDGLYLVDALSARLKEFDALTIKVGNSKQNNQAAQQSHFRRMMLARDDESGYTPLHYAILRRDLTTLLALLRHVYGGLGNNSMVQHPLRLLNGNMDEKAEREDGERFSIINDLAASLDHEQLTPLRLLGRTSASGLGSCRRTLQWKSLRKTWKKKPGSQQKEAEPLSDSSDWSEESTRRHRRRMISFGDERDHESLSYEIEEDPDVRSERERRRRSSSFNAELDAEDHNDDDENNGGGVNNGLMPLEDTDFSIWANNENRRNLHGPRSGSKEQVSRPQSEDDYGCEVLTFGRADHCALGVPQFATSGRARGQQGDNFSSPSSTSTTSCKPRRVEAFALGELRRGWPSELNRDSSSAAPSNEGRDAVNSPAVAVAAAAHHTLVSTRTGRLFSFGLGKGGRLGMGDENHRPLPTRILGPLTKRIVASIAAAENHSLCSTSDGDVYAWGSNGFGQLGISNSGLDSNNSGGSSRLFPRRVEGGDLKHAFVVAVAAGDRHSVALTRLGEVYCWGDNRSGQLGTYISASAGGGSCAAAAAFPPTSSQTNNGRCCHRPQRVEGLWSAQPRRRAIAIAAAEFSTLVLTMPPTVSSGESSLAVSMPVNTIYGWGHGNHLPMRVNFPSAGVNSGKAVYSRPICVNPVVIACAKYHSVAVTADGRVYTWGLHSESLGIEKNGFAQPASQVLGSDWATSEGGRTRPRSQSGCGPSSAMTISSPQLVVGMLPENGGGVVVAVSASESHTAVVTSDGHLYTWGACHGNGILGHKGVRWQPVPRRVERVYRAVGVAAAKEHTALLMGTSFPPLHLQKESSDDGAQMLSLQDSAAVAISRNVDLFNVIPVALAAQRLNCRPLMGFCEEFVRKNLDGVLAVGNKNDFATFLSSRTFVGARNNDNDELFHPFLYCLAKSKGWVEGSRVLLDHYSRSMPRPKKTAKRVKREGRAVMVHEEKDADATQASESVQMEKEASKDNTPERIIVEKNVARKLFQEEAKKCKARDDSTPKYHCSVCGVSCPDSDSYTLHMNGRRHRNRLMHAKSEEEKNVAESMMAMKRMQLIENNSDLIFQEGNSSSTTKSKSAWATPRAAAPRVVKPTYKSFQDILKEEQKKSLTNSVGSSNGTKPKARSNTNLAAIQPLKPAPLIAYSDTKKPFPSSPAPSLPLSAYMKKSGSQKRDPMSGTGASWGAKPLAKNINGPSWGVMPSARKNLPMQQHSAPSKMKSFSEIQQEEEVVRNNEDHMCRINGNQWFVQQRERAASIGEIQEKEKQDREMREMIEEQKRIEEEIRMRVKRGENSKKQRGKKRYGRKKKSKKSDGNAESEKNQTLLCNS